MTSIKDIWMLALVILPLSLTACSSDNDDKGDTSNSSSELVGTWISYYYAEEEYVNGTRVSIEDDYDEDLMVVFNEDGTGISYEYYNSIWHAGDSFEWTLSGDSLYTDYGDFSEVASVTKLTTSYLELITTETYTSGSDVYMTAFIVYYKKQS